MGRGEVELQTKDCSYTRFVSGPKKDSWALCRKSHLCKHKHAHLESYLTRATLSTAVTWRWAERREGSVLSNWSQSQALGSGLVTACTSPNLGTLHLQGKQYFPANSVCVCLCVLARQPQTTHEISPQWHRVAPLLSFRCYSVTCWFTARTDVHNILT